MKADSQEVERMERKLVVWLAIGVIVLAVTLLTQGFFTSPDITSQSQPLERERFLDRLWEAYQMTQDRFYQPDRVRQEKLLEEAIRGLVKGLEDPYSRFNTKEEYERFSTELEGEYEGIGAYIGLRDGLITVISPIKGGPAERQGVRAGDKILEIDGESTQGFTPDDASRRLRGPKGTTVQLKIRHSDESVEDITIVRDRIQLTSVEHRLIHPTIAYLRINNFSATVPSELREALVALRSQAPSLEGLVLDLRGNGGGYLHIAKQVGSTFVDNDSGQILLIEKSRSGEVIDRSYGNDLPNWPIAVLVDQGTASASEILAGAIRDNQMGILIGERTFGKGVIQTRFDLSDGSVIWLTTAEYLTPDRQPVQDVGLSPEPAFLVEDWHPKLLDVRRELRALDQSLPEFASASHAALRALMNSLDQLEERANSDEYEAALATLAEFEQRIHSSPEELLALSGVTGAEEEILLVRPLLERLSQQMATPLLELKARLERNVLAVAIEWLRSPAIKGRLCPCETVPVTSSRQER
jgi:carboxyl-terminal processing protease